MKQNTISETATHNSAAAVSLPISLTSITKKFGEFVALDEVSLDIESGEFLTLLGPSGSGKTTLLMVLAGFVRPNYGSVRFGDREMILAPPHKRDLGMVFQNYALFPHMSVAENVGYPLRLRRVGRSELTDRVNRALDLVQLGSYGDRRIDQLSGGQRQRVALARAIVFEPRILLMDEPLSALDKNLREHMQIEIRRLHDRLGMTTVYVTHDQREALTMSDRIVVFNEGRIVQLDHPSQLYERPNSRFVAEFIGESSFLPVNLRDGIAYLDDQIVPTSAPLPEGSHGSLVLRPEKMDIIREGEGSGDMIVLEGRCKEQVYQGESCLLYIDLSGGVEVAMRQSTRRDIMQRLPGSGDIVRLGLHPEDAIIVSGGA
ncbi:putative spermidine/putrescine transport system ATP-binding protein [Ruegeria halocynthiae]|uniref:Spermidine/putrescine import ATP-binding protein PotA n=1 Tax=Ruegeria halocynthiae TaxID=985054 RepID=A0A1H2YJA1_9RHOB|nr:ABC transporter ATP-binding protein [Ruegeria halocynthiae]SDX04629.1 putative spermidine/putrescine transport system ATP-binding protein [Ruegeria halocynthiae]